MVLSASEPHEASTIAVLSCLSNLRVRAQRFQLYGCPSLCRRTSTVSSSASLRATESRLPGWFVML